MIYRISLWISKPPVSLGWKEKILYDNFSQIAKYTQHGVTDFFFIDGLVINNKEHVPKKISSSDEFSGIILAQTGMLLKIALLICHGTKADGFVILYDNIYTASLSIYPTNPR